PLAPAGHAGAHPRTSRGDASRPSRTGPGCCPPGDWRLKALYAGFHDRALARILFFTFGDPLHHDTVQQLWQQSPITAPQQLTRSDYHGILNRSQARLQMVRLYYQGWDKVSLSRFLRISRSTVDRWIARFETEHFAGLIDRKRGPQWPRKMWFP